MSSTALADFQPVSRGFKLDPHEFGFFTDSSAHEDDPEYLRERMAEDGYLFIKHFYPREWVMAARKVVTDRLLEQGILDGNHPSEEGVLANVKVINKRTAFNGANPEGKEVKSFDPEELTDDNKPLWDLVNSKRVMDFFSAFFGSPSRRYRHIWFRAVGVGMGTPPHCDWVYMSRGTSNLCTTWVPLGDTPLHVGGLMILENSHKKSDRIANYLSKDVDDYCTNSPNAEKIKSGEKLFEFDGVLTKNPHKLRETFGGRWLTAEYEAGDLLIFNTHSTIHASLDNQSNRIRISADTRYQPANEPIDERWIAEGSTPYDKRFKRGRIC